MIVELFVFPDCPGAEGARQTLRTLLDPYGDSFNEILVENTEQAEQLGVLGSPSVHINGVEMEEDRWNDPPAFACRIYPNGNDRLCRIPEGMLEEALKRARQQEAGQSPLSFRTERRGAS